MSQEYIHSVPFINYGIPREVSIDEFRCWLERQASGDSQNPDGYLIREGKPNLDALAQRFLAWRLNHPSELN